MENAQEITTNTLQSWLQAKKPVSVLDIRPMQERTEWFIPGSIHINVYDKLKAKEPNALQGLHLDKSVPVVAVCAGGKTSRMAAALLKADGYEAYSLRSGMKGWSLSWNTATLAFDNFEIIQFRRTGKGCLSYMLVSGNEAAVIDASLPVEVYQQVLAERNIKLKFAMDTHLHADHLSRSRQLAEQCKVHLYLPAQAKVSFQFKPVTEETVLTVGHATIRSIHTPGHTLESTSYLIDNKALLTGDTLFVDSIGRPDLKASTEEVKHKAGLLYHSLQDLMTLNENIIVLPGHAGKPVEFNNIPMQATLHEIKKNVALLHLDEEQFIQTVLQRIPPTPANYLAIVERNVAGDYDDLNPMDLEAGANRCAIS